MTENDVNTVDRESLDVTRRELGKCVTAAAVGTAAVAMTAGSAQAQSTQISGTVTDSDGLDGGPFQLPTDPLSLPQTVDLPLSPLNLRTMNTGFALFIVGMYTFLGGAVVLLRNYVAAIVLGLAVVSLVMSGTLGIGLGIHWALILTTVVVLIFGAIMRVMAGE